MLGGGGEVNHLGGKLNHLGGKLPPDTNPDHFTPLALHVLGNDVKRRH